MITLNLGGSNEIYLKHINCYSFICNDYIGEQCIMFSRYNTVFCWRDLWPESLTVTVLSVTLRLSVTSLAFFTSFTSLTSFTSFTSLTSLTSFTSFIYFTGKWKILIWSDSRVPQILLLASTSLTHGGKCWVMVLTLMMMYCYCYELSPCWVELYVWAILVMGQSIKEYKGRTNRRQQPYWI